MATFLHPHAGEMGRGSSESLGAEKETGYSLQDSEPLQPKAQLLLYPSTCRTDIWQSESLLIMTDETGQLHTTVPVNEQWQSY